MLEGAARLRENEHVRRAHFGGWPERLAAHARVADARNKDTRAPFGC
jgi:hypothetical protein